MNEGALSAPPPSTPPPSLSIMRLHSLAPSDQNKRVCHTDAAICGSGFVYGCELIMSVLIGGSS